jgi:hypothetical protein
VQDEPLPRRGDGSPTEKMPLRNTSASAAARAWPGRAVATRARATANGMSAVADDTMRSRRALP